MSELTIDHIRIVVTECGNGKLKVSKAKMMAFLLTGGWFPVLAVAKRACELANIPGNLNTHRAVTLIAERLPYARFKNVRFIGHAPALLTDIEKLDELKSYHDMFQHISGLK